jgi:CRISPR system Cascade subunit CasB
MTREEVRDFANRLVSTLERWHREQNRGPLAKLRRGLSETSRHEACFVLGQHFGPAAVDNPVFYTVAACFALHPKSGTTDNFGAAMRAAMGRDRMNSKDETHARFRRLLACDSREEICRHVPHAVRLAKARDGVAVDYRKLFKDLWWWNDRVKVEWTKAYWSTPKTEESGLAGEGTRGEEDAQAIGQ